MVNEIAYDIHRGTNDRTLRLATLPGAGLPAHLKRKDSMLMPKGKHRFILTPLVMLLSKVIAFSKSSQGTKL
jgi:hypothetical protein